MYSKRDCKVAGGYRASLAFAHPSDGRTLAMPGFSGNRFASSLRNIKSNGFAYLTLISFTPRDIIYLTGTAVNHVGPSTNATYYCIPKAAHLTIRKTSR